MQNGDFTRDFSMPVEDIGADPLAKRRLPDQDRRVIPVFFTEMRKNIARSEEEGRLIAEPVEYVRIMVAGDHKNMPVHKVQDYHRRKWPEQYAAFKREEEYAEEGTPVDEWNVLARDQVHWLKHNNIFTVEHIAGLSDAQIQTLGVGALDLRKKAQLFLESSKDSNLPLKLQAENERMQAKLRDMERQMAELQSRVPPERAAAPESVPHPEAEVAPVPEAEASKAYSLEIPDDWESMTIPKKKALAKKLSVAPIKSEADADNAIREALVQRESTAA